jgi:8-hydroxy-5-deazaflavin:NADPH oxidoreductase
MEPTSVGVLGSGQVGRVLAAGFRARGHEVTLGTREPGANAELRAWADDAGVALATFAETAGGAELLVLATRGVANEEVIALAGPERFAGKVVIDATNPLDFSGGGPALAVGHSDSGGEIVQRALPGARVVKAFNTVGNALMVHPQLPSERPTMFIAGNDDAAKATVTDALADFGWSALDVGAIEASRQLEQLCILWVQVGQARGGKWDHAITLVAPD